MGLSRGAEQVPKVGDDGKGPPKQLTVDLGGGVKLEMVLIPAGEFKMGSGESAEATAAFYNKTYGENLLPAVFFEDEHPQHRRFVFCVAHATTLQYHAADTRRRSG
jgi:formylglycine-generating enzyme required for sulfatase activity